ncbi:MAG: hypothetical protein WC528_04845 [Patescibacteria group bacterium]
MFILKFLKPVKKKLLIFFGLIIITVVAVWFFTDLIEASFLSRLSTYKYMFMGAVPDSWPIFIIFNLIYLIAIYIISCYFVFINKKNLVKSLLLTLLFIGLVYGIICVVLYLFTQKPSSNTDDDKVNMTVVNNIKSQYSSNSWNLWEDNHYEIVSWNTKKYGRIYQVSAWVTDMGEIYYDREGNKIATCNSWGGEEKKLGYSCDYFNDLEYKDNDFIQS